MTLLARVCGLLDAARVPHALIGAAALAARGVARSTYDIDLLTTDVRVLAAGFWDVLRTTGVGVDIQRGDVDDPLGGVVRITAAGERPVDVVIGKWRWQGRAVERADRPPEGPPVVTARDLVLLKLYAGGTQDLWDVRALLELPERARLIAQVDDDLAELPAEMRARWGELRADS
jgi:hypothetical protein